MSIQKLILGFPALLLVLVFGAAAQDQPKEQSKTTIQHSTIKPTSPSSGKEMYESYCAVCHGTDGKGNGPAATALKVPPADLTQLSKGNGGKFPSMKVMSTIRGTSNLPAHGSEEMPIWGTLFRSISGGHESEVQQRVANLTRYVESLQAK